MNNVYNFTVVRVIIKSLYGQCCGLHIFLEKYVTCGNPSIKLIETFYFALLWLSSTRVTW